MAFHQATPIPQRQIHSYVDSRETIPTQDRFNDDSREWGLSSPVRPSVWTRIESAAQTPRTAGQSRISDFGSLNTIAISSKEEEESSEVFEDDEELDSLDDGLHAFQEPSYQGSRPPDQSGGSILPAHDGLGTFAPSSFPVQQHLWSFERHNPHRRMAEQRNWSVPRGLESLDAEHGSQMESARLERIEKWRLEQSMILLEEVEKETRRRRLSRVSNSVREEVVATSSRQADGHDTGSPSVPAVERSVAPNPADSALEDESFWQRITRHVIRDLIGIDDSLLSVLFGESLPSDGTSESIHTGASLRLAPGLSTDALANGESSADWEDRLLNRLAHELGVVVNQLSERTVPTNTYQNPLTMDYAGMPIAQTSLRPSRSNTPFTFGTNASSSFPLFKPTLQNHINSAADSEHAAEWGIEGEEVENISTTPTPEATSFPRSLHLRAILNYLQRRFIGYQRPSSSSARVSTDITNNPDSLRRAAIIHQHHPLVSRTYARARQNSSRLRQTYQPPTSLSFKRPGSTCASQSTKMSRRNLSHSSSRHYWDIGASLGNGSVIAGSIGIGAWGEV